jgi:hypothetical protein
LFNSSQALTPTCRNADQHPVLKEPTTVVSIVAASSLGTTKKVLLSLSVIGAAGSIAALGTFAQFTSSTSAAQSAGTGTLTVALGAAGTSANRLDVAAADLAPGDTVQRSVDMVTAGSVALSG